MWELKLYFYPSAGGFQKKKKNAPTFTQHIWLYLLQQYYKKHVLYVSYVIRAGYLELPPTVLVVLFHPIHDLRPSFISLPVETQIRGHIAGSSPALPTTDSCLAKFIAREYLCSPFLLCRRASNWCVRRRKAGKIYITAVCTNVCVFLAHWHFFLFRPWTFFLVLSAPGYAPSLLEHHGASVGPGRGPWHVLWGQVTTGRHSEHVEPSRPMQTHIQVEKMPDELRMLFRTLLTARTDCLPTSCSCSSARVRARVQLLLMLECSRPCSCAARAHARVLELVLECTSCPCSSARGRALVVVVVLECTSCSCSSAVELVLVIECSFFGVLARVLVLPM